jgi:hypothetical protein
MNTKELQEAIAELAVWDTHSHLDEPPRLSAGGVWDIVHYL